MTTTAGCAANPMSEAAHKKYLDELVAHGLADIGLQGKDIEIILREPVCYGYHSWDRSSMCDLLILMESKIAYPLELKGSRSKRSKAIDQMCYGMKLLEERFPEYDSSIGLFVVYTRAKYIPEYIKLK